MDAYEMGKQACRDGRAISENPFSFLAADYNWSDWLTGFNAVKSGLSK